MVVVDMMAMPGALEVPSTIRSTAGPEGPLGGGATGQWAGAFPPRHSPGAGHGALHRRKVRQSGEPAHQETQRQGAGQGRGSGHVANHRRLARVTFSLSNEGNIIAGQQHNLQFPVLMALIISRFSVLKILINYTTRFSYHTNRRRDIRCHKVVAVPHQGSKGRPAHAVASSES